MYNKHKDLLDFKITSIEPIYDYDKVSGGYFEVFFEGMKESPFKLSFVPFLNDRLKQDEKLYSFIEKRYSEKTISHAIWDLYDMEFPVDDWVKSYIETAAESVDITLFNQLLQIYYYMRGFGTEPSGSY